MNKHAAAAAVAAMTLGGAGSTASAGSIIVEVAETMMEAQAHDFYYIGSLFGADPFSTITLDSNVDPVNRSFSYETQAGQFYGGELLSLATSGAFDAGLGQYFWTTSGQFGVQSWTGEGDIVWVGDPVGTVRSSITIGGRVYRINGTIRYSDPDQGATESEASVTFTGPPGGPGGTGPFGPYKATDAFRQGNWIYEATVPKNPLVPDGIIQFTQGNMPWPDGGIGRFEVTIAPAPVPVPAALPLLASALVGTFWLFRKGKRRGSNLRTAHRNA